MFKRDNACICLNGGKCIGHFYDICECPVGFEGDRCQEVYIEFAHKPSQPDLNLILVLAMTLFGIFLTILTCFFTLRKIKALRRRHIEIAKLKNRRQSRVTIEGFSVSGHDTESERIAHAKFQSEIFQKSAKHCSSDSATEEEYSEVTKTDLVINDEKSFFI